MQPIAHAEMSAPKFDPFMWRQMGHTRDVRGVWKQCRGFMTSALCALSLVLFAACDDGQGALEPCTLIGGVSGVSLDIDGVRADHPGQQLRVRACADDACITRSLAGGSDPGRPLLVGQKLVTDGTPVVVTLRVVARGEGVVYSLSLIHI